MTTEFKVGVLVLLGIILLFYMSFRIGKFGSFTEGPGYEVSAHFKNVAGLDTKSPVEIAGVEVGRVNKVSLDGTMAKTALLMKENTKIPIDSKVVHKVLRHPGRQVPGDYPRSVSRDGKKRR